MALRVKIFVIFCKKLKESDKKDKKQNTRAFVINDLRLAIVDFFVLSASSAFTP